jgi:hypothetical protein
MLSVSYSSIVQGKLGQQKLEKITKNEEAKVYLCTVYLMMLPAVQII